MPKRFFHIRDKEPKEVKRFFLQFYLLSAAYLAANQNAHSSACFTWDLILNCLKTNTSLKAGPNTLCEAADR